jgi:lipopolysaccharide/colanic/teichoic acid biosynthesis glycosyltransferase
MTRYQPRSIASRGRRPDGDRDAVHLMDEQLFRSVLTRERKRTDRSARPFVLLLASVSDGPGMRSSPLWHAIIETLGSTKDDTDVLGWFRRRRTIGMIVSEICTSDVTEASTALEARVRRRLARRLDAESMARISIRLHVPPEPSGDDAARATISDAIKRGVDVVSSLTLLVALAPLFLLITALVKFRSPGPVFFKQVRIGYMNEPFTMLKFRTMYVNADHKLHQDFVCSFITANGAGHRPPTNGFFKLTDDPRVTPIGRLLRKTSFDELPQLWNVVRGEMSLVGPRPPIPYELVQYKSWHRRRVLEAKPGITGLWQVAGRSRTTFDDMVRLDLRYARTRSLWTDVKILLATPRAVISGKGAC